MSPNTTPVNRGSAQTRFNGGLNLAKFKQLLKDNPAKLTLWIHNLLTKKKNPRQVINLLLSYVSSFKSRQENRDARDQIGNLLIQLPNEERSTIINSLHAENILIASALAHPILKSQSADLISKQQTIYTLLAALDKETHKNERKEVFRHFGGDTNCNGVIDKRDRGWKQVAAYDKDRNGRLDYEELYQKAKTGNIEERFYTKHKVLKHLYQSILRRMQIGVVIQSDLDQLKSLSKIPKTGIHAAVYLADVRARLLEKKGQYRLAYQQYQLHKNYSGPSLVENSLRILLKVHKNHLELLEGLAAAAPYLLKNKRALPKRVYPDLENLNLSHADSILAKTIGAFTHRNIKAIIGSIPSNANAKALAFKKKLEGFLAAYKSSRFKLSLDQKPVNGLSNKDCGKNLVILVPKPNRTGDTYHISLKTGNYKIYITGNAKPNYSNPLFLRFEIPAWQILQHVRPGDKFSIVLEKSNPDRKIKPKAIRQFNLTRLEGKHSKHKVANVTLDDYYNNVLKQPVVNSVIIVAADKDHPETYPRGFLGKMIKTLRGFPYPHLIGSREERVALAKFLMRYKRDKKMEEIDIPKKVQSAFWRLNMLQDMYFQQTTKVIHNMLRKGWKLQGKPWQPKREQEIQKYAESGTDATWPRMVFTLTREVNIKEVKSPELRKKMRAAGKSRIKLKVKVVYYTDTASATRALVKAAQNDKVQFVAYQGHRYGGFKRILGEHLSKNKNPRKTNFAFVGIHCNSYHTSTKDIVAAFSGKAYVPFGTTSSVYPPPEVTFGSITSLFIHGQAPTAKVAHKLYQKVFGKKKVNPAVMKDLPKKVYRMGDRDKDGILDHIDPDPDKQNKHVYDVKKQELEIDRAGKKVYIRKISKHYLNGLVLKHKQKVINAPKKGKKMIFAPIIVARNP